MGDTTRSEPSTAPNEAAIAAWNGDSGRLWAEGADRRDLTLAAILDRLLDAAAPPAGASVLDVGCGCGATTLATADAVGPDGRALGVDLSAAMLDIARRRAAATGLGNISFLQADAQTHALPAAAHDLVLSRFGTMFFDDPHTAFANMAGSLRRGGRLCIVTWQALAANEWLALPRDALLRFGTPPEVDPNAPGMFAQSMPDQVGELLRGAGFTEVEIRPETVVMRIGDDIEIAVDHLAELGPSRAVLETIPEADRTAALDALRSALAPHAHEDGVHLEGAILVTTAVV